MLISGNEIGKRNYQCTRQQKSKSTEFQTRLLGQMLVFSTAKI